MNFKKGIMATAIFLLPFYSIAESINISSLVFTTVEQSIKPSEVSLEIIAQTQNSSGSAEKVDETNDVTFSSSSLSGQFLNSSGNPVSTTMAKNTASRTFYYKDSAEGEHTITISIKGRDTGKTFSASQKITVSQSGASSNGSNSSDDSSSANNNSSNNSSSNTNSAHSSQEPLSDIPDDFDFKTDAGRNRIVSVHTPVKFDARVAELPSSYGRVSYTWSFGDGKSLNGESATHTYLFPGEYNVVLNVSAGGGHSVSRTKVKVIEPTLSLGKINRFLGSVEIINGSAEEVNLGSFIVHSEKSKYFISEDTIISGKSSIKFPVVLENWDKVRLIYPDGELVGGSLAVSDVGVSSEEVALLQKKLDDAKEALALLIPSLPDTNIISNENSFAPVVLMEKVELSTSTASGTVEEKLMKTLSEEDKGSSLWEDMMATPKKSFEFIKNLFGQEE